VTSHFSPLRLYFCSASLVFLLVLSGFSSFAQLTTNHSPLITDSSATQRILAFLDQFQQGPLVRHGTVGLSLRRVKDGELLLGYNNRQSMQTASTMKLVSTATALLTLGPDFRYITTLEHDGVLNDGVLEGNLFVRGSGDPTLGTDRFSGYADTPTLLQEWTDVVRKTGIREIRGAVVGDGSVFNDISTPDTWPFGDLGYDFGASPYGLNINENLYRIVYRPGKTIGAPTTILKTDPPTPYITYDNRVTTDAAGTGDHSAIYGVPYQNQQWLRGKIPAGQAEFSVNATLPDPAYHVAFALSEVLRQDSVWQSSLPLAFRPGQPLPNANRKRGVLHRHQSPPLSEIVQQANFESINLYAESVLRTAAFKLNLDATDNDTAIETMTDFWRKKGVNLDGFRPRDGSGLSSTGAMTADNLTGILSVIGREKAFPVFYESIPVVGESGTVRNLAKNTIAAGNMRAKSGTLTGVRAFAGYVTAANGELLCFSMMVNRYTTGPGQTRAVTAQLERLMVLLAGFQ
jgi:serine-type D-Ala-D-Ala carboxypeptidase/endopeptidase (penicillin-binding protein 4)